MTSDSRATPLPLASMWVRAAAQMVRAATHVGRRAVGLLPLSLALGLLLGARPAAAIDITDGPPSVRLAVTESLFTQWHWLLDDAALEQDPTHVVDIKNRLNLRLTIDPKLGGDLKWSPFVIGTRLDVAAFPNPPSDQYQNDVRPEEMYFRLAFRNKTLGRVTLTLGDDYLAFGKGLAISLRKVDELGFDVNLRGGHLFWQHKLFSLRLSGGVTNVVNVDAVTSKFVPDPNDLVFAAQLELKPMYWMRFGMHAVNVERRGSPVHQGFGDAIMDGVESPPPNTGEIRSTVAGGSIELRKLAKVLTLYVEGDVLIDRNQLGLRDPEDRIGWAVYASAIAYAGPLTILAEFKHLEEFALSSTVHPDVAGQPGLEQSFPYIVPPTLERYDQRIQNNTDVTGARLRLDWAASNRDVIFLNAAWFGDAPIVDETTLHIFAGWERRFDGGDRVQLQYGVRYEGGFGEDGFQRLQMQHWDIDAYVNVAPGHDLLFHWNHEIRTEDAGTATADEYNEGTLYLTWSFLKKWDITAQFEYLTSDGTRMPVFGGGWLAYRFTPDTYVRAFVGRMKGGLKCASGICKIFPEFEGVRLETVLRF